MTIVEFDPNRQALQVLDRHFLLEIHLQEDGGGFGRLFEVSPEGKPTLICWTIKQRSQSDWYFDVHGSTAMAPEPRTAALAALRRWLMPFASPVAPSASTTPFQRVPCAQNTPT